MDPYAAVSLIFFLLLSGFFFYFWFFFPAQHPVPCLIKTLTGKDCVSCGMSRAISGYMHFNFHSSSNKFAFPVFLFFVVQWLARALAAMQFFLRETSAKWQIKLDCIISISLFLLAFLPVILNY